MPTQSGKPCARADEFSPRTTRSVGTRSGSGSGAAAPCQRPDNTASCRLTCERQRRRQPVGAQQRPRVEEACSGGASRVGRHGPARPQQPRDAVGAPVAAGPVQWRVAVVRAALGGGDTGCRVQQRLPGDGITSARRRALGRSDTPNRWRRFDVRDSGVLERTCRLSAAPSRAACDSGARRTPASASSSTPGKCSRACHGASPSPPLDLKAAMLRAAPHVRGVARAAPTRAS